MPASAHPGTVYIVEDDAAVRDALALLLALRGHATALFACAEDFLRALSPQWRGCLVADIRMPGMSGLELQQALATAGVQLPVVVVTAHGNVAAARQAMKAGAVDFLEKPFDQQRLVESIERALRHAADDEGPAAAAARLAAAGLSTREREVLELVAAGRDNGAIGAALGISPRTVEVHKARMMGKLGLRSLAELLKLHRQLAPPP